MKTFLSAGRPIRKYGLYLLVLTGLGILCVAVIGLLLPEKKGPRVLIFYWEEFASHPEVRIAGAEAMADVCSENGMQPVVTDDPEIFTDEQLKSFSAVIFMNTAGDVLNFRQEAAFQRYIQAGGGFVGVHSAIDTEHNWTWYHQLLGAYFDGNAGLKQAILTAPDRSFGATKYLEDGWVVEDDWINFRDIDPELQVVLSVEEDSYTGGAMGAWHPVAWYRDFEGGRVFYTALGHTKALFDDARFRRHLLGGIRYAIGDNKPLDYHRKKEQVASNAVAGTGFVKTSVACNLNEPMELDMFPNGNILFIERQGSLKLYKPAENRTDVVGTLRVYPENEQGLLGLAIDPHWAENHWVYLFYAPPERPVLRLSRFDFREDRLLPETEKIMLEVDVTRDAPTFHCGGSLEFDAEGHLYISIGDNTNNYGEGFVSIDERPGKSSYDSQRSAGNSLDLRGKILRIRPMPDGSYVCPAGNLFTNFDVRITPFQSSLMKDRLWLDLIHPRNRRADLPFDCYGRPEIYVMGVRNPFRISLDPRRKALFWGDVGPDAGFDDDLRGPEGYDEFNVAQSAGFYGWPYFLGRNRPYRDYDFETQTSGDWFDSLQVVNHSPNNTGARRLPYPRPALIWYPFRSSDQFPLLGNGTRCVMAGPTYYADQYPDSTRFPEKFNGNVILYDWMRGWLMAVELDARCQYKGMKPFADNLRFSRPMDMLLDAKGALWVLEYGVEWNAANQDACLSRIDFVRGKDGDQVVVENKSVVRWDVGRKNRSFFRPGDLFPYRVVASGADPGGITLAIDHVPECPSPSLLMQRYRPSAAGRETVERGKVLIDGSDCKACHDIKRTVNGPSYQAIASRYQQEPGALDLLTKKVRQGGGGVWGVNKMSAHPQLSDQDVRDMVRWILDQTNPAAAIPMYGRYPLRSSGAYVFYASHGREAGETLVLHEPMLQAEHADMRSAGLSAGKQERTNTTFLRGLQPGGYFGFRHIDLRHVKSVQIGLGQEGDASGYAIELHSERPDGPLLGSVALRNANRRPVLLLNDTAPSDFCDLYFVLKKEAAGVAARLDVDWVEFNVIEP